MSKRLLLALLAITIAGLAAGCGISDDAALRIREQRYIERVREEVAFADGMDEAALLDFADSICSELKAGKTRADWIEVAEEYGDPDFSRQLTDMFDITTTTLCPDAVQRSYD